MTRKLAPRLVAALLATAATTAVAQNADKGLEGFAQVGVVDSSGYDSDIAIKLGVNGAKNLAGVKGLGLTGFYTYWSADGGLPFGGSHEVTAHSFAAGPTFDLPIPNSKFSVQGRAFMMLTFAKAEARVCTFGTCWSASSSDNDLDFGIGFGGAYKIDEKLSVRIDYDMLDGGDILTAGLGFRF